MVLGLMGRKAKVIEGLVTDVRPVEEHKTQYRIRFRLNGVRTEAYRADQSAADALHKELSMRAIGADSGMRTALTSLSPVQTKHAEMAYHVLANANLLDLDSDNNSHLLVDAASLFADRAKRQHSGVMTEVAATRFIEKQGGRKLGDKTLEDYGRFLTPFITLHAKRPIAMIEPKDCKSYIDGQPTELARFKAHTCLAAFFNFCAGKNNPYYNPSKEPPWITRSPINFEKPRYAPSDIHSYTLAEVKVLLEEAQARRQLGYFIFRLFSMARFDEAGRFISLYSSSWTDNAFVSLKTNRITFNAQVYRKRGKGEHRRVIRIHPTFRLWIDWLCKHDTGTFAYHKPEEIATRAVIVDKSGSGYSNMLRHTAVTFHVKAFNDIADTARQAGNSVAVIMENYYNNDIPKEDAVGFYALTPDQALQEGIIKPQIGSRQAPRPRANERDPRA